MHDTREKLFELQLQADIADNISENTTEHRGFIADFMIANGVTVQEWIPVTERLPEKTDGHVLVTDGNVVKISCRNAMYRTQGGDTRCAQNYGAGMCVTHWMPLPEPPKEAAP